MQRTNSFYIQSPRLQTAVPISVVENLSVRRLLGLSFMSVHVDLDNLFGPDSWVKVIE